MEVWWETIEFKREKSRKLPLSDFLPLFTLNSRGLTPFSNILTHLTSFFPLTSLPIKYSAKNLEFQRKNQEKLLFSDFWPLFMCYSNFYIFPVLDGGGDLRWGLGKFPAPGFFDHRLFWGWLHGNLINDTIWASYIWLPQGISDSRKAISLQKTGWI